MTTTYLPKIKSLREAAKIKQGELSVVIEVNASTLRNWESGGKGFESICKIYRLCKQLGCGIEDLVEVIETEL